MIINLDNDNLITNDLNQIIRLSKSKYKNNEIKQYFYYSTGGYYKTTIEEYINSIKWNEISTKIIKILDNNIYIDKITNYINSNIKYNPSNKELKDLKLLFKYIRNNNYTRIDDILNKPVKPRYKEYIRIYVNNNGKQL